MLMYIVALKASVHDAIAFTAEVTLQLLPAQGVSNSSPCHSAAFMASQERNVDSELWKAAHVGAHWVAELVLCAAHCKQMKLLAAWQLLRMLTWN